MTVDNFYISPEDACHNCGGAGERTFDVIRNGDHDTDTSTCTTCLGTGVNSFTAAANMVNHYQQLCVKEKTLVKRLHKTLRIVDSWLDSQGFGKDQGIRGFPVQATLLELKDKHAIES